MSLDGVASKKALALLFYLATTGRTHSRDELASLFWYDMPDTQARKNLRNILPALRSLLGPHLLVNRHTVSFNRMASYWLDVETFRATLEGDRRSLNVCMLCEATALYSGDFLTGFYVPNAPAFEEWMMGQRNRLHELAIGGLSALAERYIEQGEYHYGLSATQRLLELEPWSEKAHQQQMKLLAAIGERDRALMQYDLCRRTLESEFGIEPTPETTSLYGQIKAGSPLFTRSDDQLERSVGVKTKSAGISTPASSSQPSVSMAGLPDLVMLYGREDEARRLSEWIAVDRCRLVVLTGGVGMGKTTLARSTVQRLLQMPADLAAKSAPFAGFECILWRSLREVQSLEQLLDNWLGQIDPTRQATILPERLATLFEQLRRRRCLLVLDDAERLGDSDVHEAWATPYRRLIEGIVSGEHQSCLVLVGREPPPLGAYFETTSSLVRSLCLRGLGYDAAETLLTSYHLAGSSSARRWLIDQYDGAPLFLHLAARAIQTVFHGDLETFSFIDRPMLDAICAVLDAEFAALRPFERDVIVLLATNPQLRSLSQVLQALHQTPAAFELLNVLERLQGRSLLFGRADGFMIPRLVQTYVRTRVQFVGEAMPSGSAALPAPLRMPEPPGAPQEDRIICLLQPS